VKVNLVTTSEEAGAQTVHQMALEGGSAGSPSWVPWYAVLLIALDGLTALAGAEFARWLRFGLDHAVLSQPGFKVQYAALSVVLVPMWIAAMAFGGAYDRRVVGVGSEEYRRVFDSAVRVLALVAIIAFAADLQLARGFVAVALPAATALTMAARYCARRWLQRQRVKGYLSHKVIVVGSVEPVQRLIRHLRGASYAGLSVMGACVPGGASQIDVDGEPVEVVAEPQNAAEAILRLRADAVAVADTASLNGDLRRLAWSLEGTGIDLIVAPALTDVAGPRIVTRPVAGLPLLHVEEPRLSGFHRVIKEVFDRGASALALVVLSPLLVAVAIVIRLTSRGPAMFRQTRVGRDGHHFTIRKFRTMRHGAELEVDQLAHANAIDDVLFKIRDDPRCTPIGRRLRRFSIDELPQLWNVLTGDMSIVGPRPPLPTEVEGYDEHVRRRLMVKPGLTGLWQVSGRSDLAWEETVRLDLYYVENWSPALDVLILWKTVSAVIRGRGAY